MVADKDFMSGVAGSKAPPFEEFQKQLRPRRRSNKCARQGRSWSTQSETAYSFFMEVCNAHPKAGKTAALYVGKIAKGLLRALKERFLNVKKNTVQAEVTKFNSMKITSNQSGAEFVDSVEAQAKILENLGREVTEDDKLTRLKDSKPKVPVCNICDVPGHHTKDCFHLRTAKAAVANTKRGRDPRGMR